MNEKNYHDNNELRPNDQQNKMSLIVIHILKYKEYLAHRKVGTWIWPSKSLCIQPDLHMFEIRSSLSLLGTRYELWGFRFDFVEDLLLVGEFFFPRGPLGLPVPNLDRFPGIKRDAEKLKIWPIYSSLTKYANKHTWCWTLRLLSESDWSAAQL